MRVNSTITKSGFRNGIRRLRKEHKQNLIDEVAAIVTKLENQEITSSNHNHPLTGTYRGFKDLYLSDGDTVLIYKYENNNLVVDLILQNLGPHDEVFPNTKSGRKAVKRLLKEELIVEEIEYPQSATLTRRILRYGK